MKRTYQKPRICGIHDSNGLEMLASSLIPVGGKGNYDVKEDQTSRPINNYNVWDDDWSE